MEYCGLRNSIFTFWCGAYSKTPSDTVSTIKRFVPPCTITVVKYSAAEGTIVTEAITSLGIDAPVKSVTGKTQSSNYYYPYAFSHIYLTIPKIGDDIILAIEVEYPKYDITLSGTGLQYSLDDGSTFADVTNGLVLNQVEHIVFKNADTVTHNIGTTEGGADVAALASGATYVAVPTASGTWYIS